MTETIRRNEKGGGVVDEDQAEPIALTPSVRDALAALGVTPVDRAAADLALVYAAAIDAGANIARLGPALLVCLESLGMTPRGRRSAVRGAVKGGANPLDELRQRRRR